MTDKSSAPSSSSSSAAVASVSASSTESSSRAPVSDLPFPRLTDSALPKFSAYGSFRQRNGDPLGNIGTTVEAPAKLESSASPPRPPHPRKGGLSIAFADHHLYSDSVALALNRDSMASSSAHTRVSAASAFGGINHQELMDSPIIRMSPDMASLGLFGRPRVRSTSTDLDRERAWDQKRLLHLQQEEEERKRKEKGKEKEIEDKPFEQALDSTEGEEDLFDDSEVSEDSDDDDEDDESEDSFPIDESGDSFPMDDDYDMSKELRSQVNILPADDVAHGVDIPDNMDVNVNSSPSVKSSAISIPGNMDLNVKSSPSVQNSAIGNDDPVEDLESPRKLRKNLPGHKSKSASFSFRSRVVTDADMQELIGSFDLGFGFSLNERSFHLKKTLPALELYYAIGKNLANSGGPSTPSPVSSGAVRSALGRANSIDGSTPIPAEDHYRISSPGDRPSLVKARLRHWAQAVAYVAKQGRL